MSEKELTPEEIINDSIREFCHIHEDGVCKPDCYACFQFKEGMRALNLQRAQIAKFVEEFDLWEFESPKSEMSRELGCHGPMPDLFGTMKALARKIRAGGERA